MGSHMCRSAPLLSAGPLVKGVAGGRQQAAREPAPALESVVRRAMCLPSLAPKYERPQRRGRLTLEDLPVLTRHELETATAEALALGLGGGTLWAHSGTLGAPGLSLLPPEMFAPAIRDDWNPLGPADVVANLHPAGRMQPDHYFFNRFAAASGATVLPVGRLPEDPDDDWLAFFARHHVTAVAAPPQAVVRLLGASTAGRPVPWLRTLLLGGAFHDATEDGLLASRFPYTDVWRLYGTPTAWVIGQRGPQCLADVYHPLSHQHVEVIDGRLLVTTLTTSRLPPLIRYDTQERGEFAHCACGRPGPAVRVLGARPPSFRFHGHTVSARELVDLATAHEEVADAQVAVGADQRIQLRVRLAPGVADDHHSLAWIRFRVLESHLALAACAREQPDAFEVISVDELSGPSTLVSEEF
ncbi:hypothetical protein ACIGW4_00865 [Streptomyces sp. NPDC053513]|uniref:hypothetical protein n=1 Tax=unclassified Streptomyces TaxID=2593676 RepID=UPI0037CF75D3